MDNQLTIFNNENDRQPEAVGLETFVMVAPEIPVIQLWQPWASWVMEGWKLIETRTHNNFHWMLNKTIAVHACRKWDKDAIDIARPYLAEWQIRETEKFKMVRGMIIGKAKVIEYRRLNKDDSIPALIDCENTLRYGLRLASITKIKPVKFTGAQRQLYISEVQV